MGTKKRIVVTGGAGFVGSHLCEKLVKIPNINVYSIDNYFTGKQANHVAGVTYIDGHTADIENLVKFSPDMIYHLGEYSRVEQSFEDIQEVWRHNIRGTFAVLEFVKKIKCKLIYAGSSTKFGDGGFGKDSSPYAWTKSSNTELVKNYGDWFNIPYAITYFYNVYGPREIRNGKYATLIGIFKEKMIKCEDLTVVKPGSQLRNFTHIDDIINGLMLVGEFGFGDEFGIGSPEAYSILDVAKMFGGNIKMIPERQGNRMSAEVVTDKTRALGWQPKISLSNYIDALRKNGWED